MNNLNIEITKQFSQTVVTINGQLEAKSKVDLIQALPHLIDERHNLIVLDLCGVTQIDLISSKAIISAKSKLKNIGAKLDVIAQQFHPIFDVLHHNQIKNNFTFMYPTELQIAC